MNIAVYPKFDSYRDSGEGWLEEVPVHWKSRKLKQLFKEKKHKANMDLNCGAISFGEVVEKDDDRIPLATKASYQEVLSGEFLVNPLNLNYDLKSLRIGLSNINVAVSAGYIVLQAKAEMDKRYFNYLLHRYDVANMKLLGSGVRQTISFNHIANSHLVEPPLPEQRAISTFLDKKCAKIDEAVRIKEEQIKLLRERRQILIQQAVTCGLNPDAPMKDSGIDWIGKIPAHWKVRKVKQIFRLVADAAGKNNSHELLSIYTDIGVRPRKDLEERGNKASTTDGYWMVRKGDFIVNKLLAWMGAIGLSEYDGVTSPAYDILRPRVVLNGQFFHRLFRSKSFSLEIKRFSRGIMEMRLRIYFDRLGVLLVPFPPKSEQDEIIFYLNEHEQKTDRAISIKEDQIAALKEYKTTLINAAVTGKIKITEDRR